MTYLIAEPCVDLMDRSCVAVCPVDCIYVGDRKLYINPAACIECGACEPECPVDAIVLEEQADEGGRAHLLDNAEFFARPLPGRDEPLGDPGGAAAFGALGVDTPLVAGLPVRSDRT